MIKFFKTNGVPKKTFAGSEEIHFTDTGFIYVADNEGRQQPMYGNVVSAISKSGEQNLSISKVNGETNVINLDFYSTRESDRRYISQDNPRVGQYQIYHEGNPPIGSLTPEEKRKLMGISPGAEVNQNAYSVIEVDSTVLTANKKTDKIIFEPGNNINFSIDQLRKVVTVNATLGRESVERIGNIDDVNIQSVENGDIIMYDSETQTWKNSPVIVDEIYLKSPDGKLWAFGVENDGTTYIEDLQSREEE